MTQPIDPKLPKSNVAQTSRGAKPAAPTNEAFDKEVDEELQREWFSQLWEQYSGYILAGAVALVLGVGAYKLIESRRQSAAEAEGARYIAAIKQLNEGKIDEGTQALAAIGKANTGFATIARLRVAAADAATGKTADALAKYEAISLQRGTYPVLADFARLQTAMLSLDTASWEVIQTKLAPLTADNNAWRFNAREVLGLAALKAGKTDEARGHFEKLIGDQAVPQGMAERARIVMGSIATADLATKGILVPQSAPEAVPATVPAPVTAPPPAPAAAGKKK